MVVVLGSKVTCCLCGGSIVTVDGPKLHFSDCDDRMTCDLVLVWVVVVVMDSVFRCRPEIAWI